MSAADPVRKVLRSVLVSDVLIVVLPSQNCKPVGDYPTRVFENVNVGRGPSADLMLRMFGSKSQTLKQHFKLALDLSAVLQDSDDSKETLQICNKHLRSNGSLETAW